MKRYYEILELETLRSQETPQQTAKNELVKFLDKKKSSNSVNQIIKNINENGLVKVKEKLEKIGYKPERLTDTEFVKKSVLLEYIKWKEHVSLGSNEFAESGLGSAKTIADIIQKVDTNKLVTPNQKKLVQFYLLYYNYYDGQNDPNMKDYFKTCDGVRGPLTKNAIWEFKKRFQRTQSIAQAKFTSLENKTDSFRNDIRIPIDTTKLDTKNSTPMLEKSVVASNVNTQSNSENSIKEQDVLKSIKPNGKWLEKWYNNNKEYMQFLSSLEQQHEIPKDILRTIMMIESKWQRSVRSNNKRGGWESVGLFALNNMFFKENLAKDPINAAKFVASQIENWIFKSDLSGWTEIDNFINIIVKYNFWSNYKWFDLQKVLNEWLWINNTTYYYIIKGLCYLLTQQKHNGADITEWLKVLNQIWDSFWKQFWKQIIRKYNTSEYRNKWNIITDLSSYINFSLWPNYNVLKK